MGDGGKWVGKRTLNIITISVRYEKACKTLHGDVDVDGSGRKRLLPGLGGVPG